MSELRMPPLRASPFALLRSDLRFLRVSGEVAAREPIAVCSVRIGSREEEAGLPLPFQEEQHDLQVVLAPRSSGRIAQGSVLSRGGFWDWMGSDDWSEGKVLGSFEPADGRAELLPLVLAGRRGFENGEGRGSLLSGWHERVRASWEGDGGDRYGTVLSLGTCEHTAVFRGDDMAFLSWFARAPGPAQMVAVSDERTVHSSAVLLQHLRRTAEEARAITEAVHAWMGELIAKGGADAFPAFAPGARRGIFNGRWPNGQGVLFALHLLTEAVGASPILEQTQLLTRRGVVEQGPPDAIALSLGSEFSPHFRHRRTGWIIAIHGFRFGRFIGKTTIEWLRRDFDRLQRTVADSERDLDELAREIGARTGASLLVQNLIASSGTERIPNYAWLGESYAESNPVIAGEANLMLHGLTRQPNLSVIDSDALAVELGVREIPDRIHGSRVLLDAQRDEFQRVLRDHQVPGF